MERFESHTTGDYLKVPYSLDVIELVRYLKSNPQIKRLSIFFENKIKIEECKALSLIPGLDSIDIKYLADIDDQSIRPLSEIKSLTSLKIYNHYITSDGAKELSKCTNLMTLIICETSLEQIDEQYVKDFSPVFVKSLTKLTNLTKLKLKDVSFINNEFVKLLADIECFHNLWCLDLSDNNIGYQAASALADSLNFPSLTHLVLLRTNIDFEGAKELARSYKLKKLEVVDLFGSDLHDVEGIVELSKITYSRTKPIFSFRNPLDTFHDFLKKVLSNEMTIDEMLERVVQFFTEYHNSRIFKYLVAQKEKYQLRLNSVLASSCNYSIFHCYFGQPEQRKFLFELGALPAALSPPNPKYKSTLQLITEAPQSVHLTPVVKKTKFITKYLVDSTNTTKEKVDQVLHSLVQNVPSLLRRYQNDPIRLKLLCLTESEKICILENTLCGWSVPNDREFVETVICTAIRTLEEKYNKTGNVYSETRMHYDCTMDEATITIPLCIGYCKLYIDNFPIPFEEKIELLVTVMEQNPNLVKDKLGKENLDRPQLYEWLKNLTSDNVGQLFSTVSGLDIEQIWREQKEFVLLKQIYISATAYGEDNSACTQGVWSQIVASLDEIDFKLLNRYEQHLDRERDRERLMPIINRNNSTRFADDLARKLIEYAAFRPTVRKSLEEFVFGLIDMKNFENITFEQQQVFAQLHRDFTCNVRKFLPNYERGIPTEEEYDILIENVLNSKPLQDFAKGPCCT